MQKQVSTLNNNNPLVPAIDVIMKHHTVSKELIHIEKWNKQKLEEMLQLFEQLVLYSNDHTKVIPVFIPIYKQAIAHDNTILLSVINILARIFFNHISIVKPNLFPQFFHTITYYKNNFSTYALYISAITESDRTNIIYQLEKIFLTKKGRDIAENNYDYELASYPIENIVPIIDLCKEKCVKGDFDAISSIYFLKRYYKKYYNDYIKYIYVGTGVEVYDKKFLLLNISKYAYVLEPMDSIPLFFILINLYGIHLVEENEALIQNVFEKFDDSLIYEKCRGGKYPSYETMIYKALSNNKGPMSLQKIKKYILANYDIPKDRLNIFLPKALKRLVEDGKLIKATQQSYLLSKTFVASYEEMIYRALSNNKQPVIFEKIKEFILANYPVSKDKLDIELPIELKKLVYSDKLDRINLYYYSIPKKEVDFATYKKYIKPKTPHIIAFKNEEFTTITNKIAEEN